MADAAGRDTQVPHGAELLAFVDAILSGGDLEQQAARDVVFQAVGAAAFVDVCATVASFNAVVKLADGTGIPLEEAKAERTQDLRSELGIDALRSCK
ncbi:MAG: hypothetical protein JXQ99_04050 [Hyphomicrobiaceae bacterium]